MTTINHTPSKSVYDIRDYGAYKYEVIANCRDLVARLREYEYTGRVVQLINQLLRTADDIRDMSPSEVDWRRVDECLEDAIDYLQHMAYRGCL